MLDFFNDHPILAYTIAVILVIAIIVGAAYFARNLKNTIFGGNEQVFDTKWRFEWAIVQLGNGELLEGPVSSWKDFENSDMVQFTMDGVTYLTHSSNVILCSKCP